MFTGIVDHCGIVTNREPRNRGLFLTIETNFEDLVEGESIAVDGACLTVVHPKGRLVSFDLSSETVERTIARRYSVGHRVNLERALRLSDRIGGYLLTGHIEHVATVGEKNIVGDCIEFAIHSVPVEFQKYLLPKGNICVQGVSLTLNSMSPDSFRCLIIPHTLERTNLIHLNVGDAVNLEFDWVTKVIAHQVNQALSTKEKEL